MKNVISRLSAVVLGIGMLAAAGMANAKPVSLTDQEMESVTAGLSLSNTGAVAISTAQAVSTQYFHFTLVLNAGAHNGLNNNGIYWQLTVTR